MDNYVCVALWWTHALCHQPKAAVSAGLAITEEDFYWSKSEEINEQILGRILCSTCCVSQTIPCFACQTQTNQQYCGNKKSKQGHLMRYLKQMSAGHKQWPSLNWRNGAFKVRLSNVYIQNVVFFNLVFWNNICVCIHVYVWLSVGIFKKICKCH